MLPQRSWGLCTLNSSSFEGEKYFAPTAAGNITNRGFGDSGFQNPVSSDLYFDDGMEYKDMLSEKGNDLLTQVFRLLVPV
jgi:hypothetical protein